jgi:hypothetical protein
MWQLILAFGGNVYVFSNDNKNNINKHCLNKYHTPGIVLRVLLIFISFNSAINSYYF